MAVLASCPGCGQTQVSVLGPELDLLLKCRRCRSVFPAGWRDQVPTLDQTGYADDDTLVEAHFEPVLFGPATLVVVADLPSVYPRKRKRQRRRKRRRENVPYAEPAIVMDWVPAPVVIEPDPVPVPPPVAPRSRPGPRRPRWVDDEDRPFLHTPIGIFTLLLPALALLLAAVSPLAGLVRPLAAAGLIVGVLGTRRVIHAGDPMRAPIGLTVLSAVILIASFFAPSLLGPSFRGASGGPPPAPLTVVPYPEFAGDLNLRRAEWVNAGMANVKQGTRRLSVTGVWIGAMRAPGAGEVPTGRSMCVRMRLYRDDILAADADPPKVADDLEIRLTDLKGRPLALKSVDQWAAVSANVEAGQMFEMTVAFEVPPTHPRALRLEVPGPVWSATLPARFEIPGSMIRYGPPQPGLEAERP